MRSGWMILMVAFAWVVTPRLASAEDDVQEQLREMQERMLLLEDRLHATADQLDAATKQVNEQKQVMSNAGLEVEDAGASGIDSFLQSLEIGGWVNISYWHNFNDPGNGELCNSSVLSAGTGSMNANTGNLATAAGFPCGSGVSGAFNTLNPDAQGFSFDQMWFELERPVSPEQRSGFRADIAVGKIADLLAGDTGSIDSDDDIYIHQANIQYLAPVPYVGDVKLTLGKFSTLLGYEVPQAPYNYNISRSILWAAFQPVDHLGFLMSGQVDRRFHFLGAEGVIDWDFGVVNGFSRNDPDINHGKTWTGRVRMTGEAWSISVAGITGAEAPGSESDKRTVIDVIFTWDPFTDLTTWMNFNREWRNPDGADPDGWGISLGGHYTITERIGATLRIDFAQVENPGGGRITSNGVFQQAFSPTLSFGQLAQAGGGLPAGGGFDEEALSITGTLHYQLSDRIKVRGELRWDDFERFCRRAGGPANALNCTDSIFNERSADGVGTVQGGDSDQFVAGVDVIYEF